MVLRTHKERDFSLLSWLMRSSARLGLVFYCGPVPYSIHHFPFRPPGLKPYKCGTCDKAFAQQANMVKHQMLHTGNDLDINWNVIVIKLNHIHSSVPSNRFLPTDSFPYLGTHDDAAHE